MQAKNGVLRGAARAPKAGRDSSARLNAFITRFDYEKSQKRKRPRKFKYPPFDRMPLTLAIKDNISVYNHLTTCASGILQNYQSPYDAYVTKRLSNPNYFALTGKTNMDEFGMGSHSINSFFGQVKMPGPSRTVDDQFSAGGSSGGSALAIKAEESHCALGTDTGGSVRLPAAYVGVVGFKPSYGLISRFGVVPYANSLDTVGILGETAYYTQAVFEKAQSPDWNDPTSLQRNEQSEHGPTAPCVFENLTIGVPLEYNIVELSSEVRKAWIKVLDRLQEKGCKVVPISLPMTKHALSAYYVIAAAEAMSNLAKYDGVRYGHRDDGSDGVGDVLYSRTRGQGFGDEVKRRILLGSYTLSSEAMDNYFLKAQKVRRLVQRDFDRVFALKNPLQPPQQFDLSEMEDPIILENKLGPPQVDFIICPTAPTSAPRIKDVENQSSVDSYMNDILTVPASLAGLPAISIPVDLTVPNPRGKKKDKAARKLKYPTDGMLPGIQIIGQYLDDKRVLDFAEKLEALFLREDVSEFNKAKDRRLERIHLKNQKYADAAKARTAAEAAEAAAAFKRNTPLGFRKIPYGTDFNIKMIPATDPKKGDTADVKGGADKNTRKSKQKLVRFHHYERRDPEDDHEPGV